MFRKGQRAYRLPIVPAAVRVGEVVLSQDAVETHAELATRHRNARRKRIRDARYVVGTIIEAEIAQWETLTKFAPEPCRARLRLRLAVDETRRADAAETGGRADCGRRRRRRLEHRQARLLRATRCVTRGGRVR